MLREIFTILLIVIGSIFSLIGVLGYIRLPDVYTRLHATGKVGVFGATLICLAVAFYFPANAGKCLLVAFLIWIVGPALSSAIAAAAARLKIPFK